MAQIRPGIAAPAALSRRMRLLWLLGSLLVAVTLADHTHALPPGPLTLTSPADAAPAPAARSPWNQVVATPAQF